MKVMISRGIMFLASAVCVLSFILFSTTAAQAQSNGGSNPWGYTFSNYTEGRVITDPPRGFCNYFNCVHNFYIGRGYVVECGDGKVSLSGGRRGACSDHWGVYVTLYQHPDRGTPGHDQYIDYGQHANQSVNRNHGGL